MKGNCHKFGDFYSNYLKINDDIGNVKTFADAYKTPFVNIM